MALSAAASAAITPAESGRRGLAAGWARKAARG